MLVLTNTLFIISAELILPRLWLQKQKLDNYTEFCKHQLISAFKQKFNYELNSSVYQVSAILKTSILKRWYDRENYEAMRSRAFDKIEDVIELFKVNNKILSQTSTIENNAETSSDDSFKWFL